MKMLKIITVSVALFGGAAAANASPFDTMNSFDSLLAIDSARSAVVLSVDSGEASALMFGNDVQSVQQRIKNNQALLSAISAQGYTLDQIVGVAGSQTDLTLYAL